MAKIRFDGRNIEVLYSTINPVSDHQFNLFMAACQKTVRDPVGISVFRSLPKTINTFLIEQSKIGPMTWRQGFGEATVTIHPTYFTNLPPGTGATVFNTTVVHEILHGSEDIDAAAQSVISLIFAENPHLTQAFEQHDRAFYEVVEHVFVQSAAHIVAHAVFGKASEAYALNNAEGFLRSKFAPIANEQLSGIQGIFDAHIESALPGIAPQFPTS